MLCHQFLTLCSTQQCDMRLTIHCSWISLYDTLPTSYDLLDAPSFLQVAPKSSNSKSMFPTVLIPPHQTSQRNFKKRLPSHSHNMTGSTGALTTFFHFRNVLFHILGYVAILVIIYTVFHFCNQKLDCNCLFANVSQENLDLQRMERGLLVQGGSTGDDGR